MKKILFLLSLALCSYAKAAPQTIIGARTSATTVNFGVTSNFTLFAGFLSTESDNDLLFSSTGTLTKMWIKISANSIAGGSSTIIMRKNSVDSNLTISIAAGTTGNFSDNVSTDTINGGDKFHYQCRAGGTSGNIQIMSSRVVYTATSDSVSRIFRVSNSGSAMQTTKTVYWNSGTTEATTNCYVPTAGTINNLWIKVGSNSNIGIITAKGRLNGADANLTVTIPATTTGSFEDKTNSDSVVSGDKYTIKFSGGGASGTATFYGQAYDYKTTTNDTVVSNAGYATVISGTTRYPPIIGPLDNNTESIVRIPTGFDATIKGIYIYLDLNPWTAISTHTLAVDGISTVTSATITASTPGWYMDTTDYSVIKATSEINYRFTRGSATNNPLNAFVTWFHVDASTGSSGRTRRFSIID